MLSENSLKQISHIFCGDTEGYYVYKSGPKLVVFFNRYFQGNDIYGQGFPSRWAYVYNKLVDLINKNRFDSFLKIILSTSYLISENEFTVVEAAEKSQEIFKEFNRILKSDQCQITKRGDEYHLVKENEDLEYVGSGGFAVVFLQKSTGLIVKRLKDDFLTDRGIRSRFKREFNITKELQGTFGIIDVYTFDDGNMSYTMEKAETTLEQYIVENSLPEKNKINCIRQILHVMTEVHEKDIIHRDLSPNNVFIISGMIKIADFGLGKDLNVFTSHQTLHTNAVGQYSYCAPEQFMLLKDGDKRSDVYSLGRLINFIMTKDPRNSHHIFRNISEKATNSDASYRYADAKQLFVFFEKSIEYNKQSQNQERIDSKIKRKEFDDEIENYIYNMSGEAVTRKLQANNTGYAYAFLEFMKIDDSHAEYIIQSVDKNYQEICGRTFEAYDSYSSFARNVLIGDYSFRIKEIAANILRYVAWDVNRFNAQHMVKEIINAGVDPMLEEIIEQ